MQSVARGALDNLEMNKNRSHVLHGWDVGIAVDVDSNFRGLLNLPLSRPKAVGVKIAGQKNLKKMNPLAEV